MENGRRTGDTKKNRAEMQRKQGQEKKLMEEKGHKGRKTGSKVLETTQKDGNRIAENGKERQKRIVENLWKGIRKVKQYTVEGGKEGKERQKKIAHHL